MVTQSTSLNDNISMGCGCASCERSENLYNETQDTNTYYYINSNGDQAEYAQIAPPDGGNNDPNNLESGNVWANNGNGLTLYYNFWDGLPSYYSNSDDEANGLKTFTSDMEDAATRAFDLIESFTNITFVETTSESQTHLGFAQATLPNGVGAWAYYPYAHPKGGDVWTNTKYVSETNLVDGGYDFYTILHEIGHALGLEHTFEVGFTGAQNTEQYSVMAYNWSTWGNVYAESYQLYDIYALQNLYGANTDYNAGNTTYTLESGHAYTIWDGGGTDTLDGSHLNDGITINLETGTFSSVGLVDNIAIAYDTVIENAIGGSGNDIFHGNDENNVITGNNGDDAFYGSAGNDTLDGGNGDDRITYNADLSDFIFTFVDPFTVVINSISGLFGTDTVTDIETYNFGGSIYDRAGLEANGQSGSLEKMNIRSYWNNGDQNRITSKNVGITTIDADTIGYTGASGNLYEINRSWGGIDITLLQDGGLDALRIDGKNTNDILTIRATNTITADITLAGGVGNDTLSVVGFSSKDYLSGGEGDDTLNGGDGFDRLLGDAGNDTLNGENGDDKLYGHEGNDIINGGNGFDTLYGHDGTDTLNGDAGEDNLYGLNDNDILNGGVGNDRLYGGNNDDILNGGDDNDRLEGDEGNDILNGDAGIDRLYGRTGNDELNGGTGDDKLYGGDGNDTLNGGEGKDVLYGNNDIDVLFGNAGKDILYGEHGADILVGGTGKDFLYGGQGSDTFGFVQIDGQIDRLQDFQLNGAERDALNITDILSGFDSGIDDINDFVALRYVDSTRTDLKINADGSGNDWTTVAYIKSSDFSGTNVDDLLASGQLITNETLL